jgi:hypothetical protein
MAVCQNRNEQSHEYPKLPEPSSFKTIDEKVHMARKMQQILFGFTLFAQCAIALSSSSEHSLFHLAPSTVITIKR